MKPLTKLASVIFAVLVAAYVLCSLIAGFVMETHDYFAQAWRIPNWPVWLKILLVVFSIAANIPAVHYCWRSVYGIEKTRHHNHETDA
jgi:hypothetical protein